MLCRLFLLMACALCSVSAMASQMIQSRAYFVDPAGQMGLAQVQQQTFKSFEGLLSQGYGDSVVWVRLRIRVKDIQAGLPLHNDSLFVRIRPAYIDRVQLYDPAVSQQPIDESGDRYQGHPDAYRSLNLNLLLPRGQGERDIYLRFQTTSSRTASIEVLEMEEVLALDRRQEMVYGLYLSLIGVLFIWALLHWIDNRTMLTGVFVFKQLMAMAWTTSILGFARLWVPQDWFGAIDLWTNYSVATFCLSSLMFDYWFLKEYPIAKVSLRVLQSLFGFVVLEYLLLLSGHTSLAMQLNMAVIFFEISLVFLSVLFMPTENPRQAEALPKWVLVLGYGVIFLSMGNASSTLLGIKPQNDATLPTLTGHALITAFIMVALLHVRGRRVVKVRRQLEDELLRTKAQMQQESHFRQEQQGFISMLVHELKTPLSVIRMENGMLLASGQSREHALAINEAARDMDAIIERSLMTSELEISTNVVQAQDMDLMDLCTDLVQKTRRKDRFELVGQGRCPMHSDPQLVRLMISNLLENALKYGAAEQVICIVIQPQMHAQRSGYLLTVSNAPGVSGWPEPTRVFDKFYRAKGAHHASGSGLGLYLVQKIAQTLGAEVRYEPSRTHITFCCWWPALGIPEQRDR